MQTRQIWLLMGCALMSACGNDVSGGGEPEELVFDEGIPTSLIAPSGCTPLLNAPAVSLATKTIGADQGGYWNLWSNGYVEQTVSFPSAGTYQIVVEAQGSVVRGVGAQMEVRIDQARVGGAELRNATWSSHEFSANVTAGAHKVQVAFTNDASYGTTEDRNLLVRALLVAPTSCGSSNLALNKVTRASSTEADYTSAKAADGSTSTRWSSQFTDPQWFQVDLGASYVINRVKLTWEVAYAKAYRIEVSSDAATWTTAYSTTTGDGGVNDLGELTATGRYVRVYGTARGTQWGYSLWELEVYGGSSGPSEPEQPEEPEEPEQPQSQLTWTQIRSDNGTLATRPWDPSRNIRRGDNGVYPVLNFGFSWYYGGDQYLGDPTRIPSTRWSAMTVWHIIYPEAQSPGGPPKPTVANKNIIFRRYRSWVHLKTGGWVETQNAPPDRIVTWQADAEQSNSLTGNANVRIVNDPSTGEPLYYENAPAPMYMNHGWPNARGTFASGSIDGAFSVFDVKCDQPGANLLVASGIDWWENAAAPWPLNTGYSQSAWIRVTTDWKTVTGTSLDEAILRADPPPPLVGIRE